MHIKDTAPKIIECIPITLRNDGSCRLNFKSVNMGKGFNICTYANEMAKEIVFALDGLVGKK